MHAFSIVESHWKTRLFWLVTLSLLATQSAVSYAQNTASGPDIMVYKTVAGTKLTAHVFRPAETNIGRPRPAIVLFHGGGWSIGSPEWVYDAAKRYASFGAVTVATEYRLADKNTLITPIEALEDARDVALGATTRFGTGYRSRPRRGVWNLFGWSLGSLVSLLRRRRQKPNQRSSECCLAHLAGCWHGSQ